MALKRSHTKSRLGCTQCKSRRIKCDEKAPACANCVKKGIECDYEIFKPAIENVQLLTPATFPHRSTRSSIGSKKSDPDTQDAKAPSTASFTLTDLGLVHYFTLYTSQTVAVNDSAEYCLIWQHEVPVLAQSYPFLMHAILAFTAAHQAALSGGSQGYSLAHHHYSKALNLFRESFDEITAERADALLCYCILICFLTLHLESVDDQNPIQEFVSFLQVLATSIGVLKPVQETLKASRIGCLLSHTRDSKPHAIQPEVEASLTRLEKLALTYFGPTSDSGDLAIAVDAILKLRRYYTLLDPHPTSWMYIVSWPVALGSEFCTLLENHESIALCILAHWCVPAYNVPAKWFSGDWPQKLMEVISERLQGSPYREAIEWPLKETLDAPENKFHVKDQEMSDA